MPVESVDYFVNDRQHFNTYNVSHLFVDFAWVDFGFSTLRNSTWAGGNLAEAAVQIDTENQNKPNWPTQAHEQMRHPAFQMKS